MERGAPEIGRGSTGAAPEGTTSTTIVREACASSTVAGADRTWPQWHTRPPQARPGPSRARKAAAAPLQQAGDGAAPTKPSYARTSPPGGSAVDEKPPARRGPDGPEGAQIWAEQAPPPPTIASSAVNGSAAAQPASHACARLPRRRAGPPPPEHTTRKRAAPRRSPPGGKKQGPPPPAPPGASPAPHAGDGGGEVVGRASGEGGTGAVAREWREGREI